MIIVLGFTKRNAGGCGKVKSWAWASILKGRDILIQGLRRQVNDGKRINFWEDKWVPTLRHFKLSSPKPQGCEISTVAEVIKPGFGVWDMQKIKQLYYL